MSPGFASPRKPCIANMCANVIGLHSPTWTTAKSAYFRSIYLVARTLTLEWISVLGLIHRVRTEQQKQKNGTLYSICKPRFRFDRAIFEALVLVASLNMRAEFTFLG
ncbi:unnamed protein product [Diplocarpon coronariae]